MAPVESIENYLNRKLETVSNIGQARKMERIADNLEDDIKHLQSMLHRNLLTDIENGKMTEVIDEYTETMSQYRSQASRLRSK